MTLDVTATAYSGLGEGPHDVTVTGIERRQSQKFGGDYFRWEFTNDAGQTASDNTSGDLTPGNKTGKRYAALTGKVVQVGGSYSLGECIGRPCSIYIELNAEGYPKIISVTPRTVTPRRVKSPAVAAAEEHAKQEGDELPF